MLPVSRIVLVIVIMFVVVGVDAQSLTAPLTPTPFMPSGTPAFSPANTDIIPKSDIYYALSTAVAYTNSLPDNLANSGGTNIIPNESATQLFAYAKWLFSGTSANELLGATLAPIGINLYVLLTLVIVLTVVWFTVKLIALLFRFIQFVIGWILRIVPGLGG